MFAGSGALALESLSRGAQKAYVCDNNRSAIRIIKANAEKTHFEEKVHILEVDYKKAIARIPEQADVIFIDPPYERNIAVDAVKRVMEHNLLKEDGIIILETDQLERDEPQLKNIENIKMEDLRDYGRVKLIFLNRKG